MSYANEEFLIKLELLKTEYEKAHPLKSSFMSKLFDVGHVDTIKSLITNAVKLINSDGNYNKNNLLDKMERCLKAGAKKHFGDEGDALEKFIEKINAEPNKHLFYRGIGIILKENNNSLCQNLNEPYAAKEAKEEKTNRF